MCTREWGIRTSSYTTNKGATFDSICKWNTKLKNDFILLHARFFLIKSMDVKSTTNFYSSFFQSYNTIGTIFGTTGLRTTGSITLFSENLNKSDCF